VQFDLAFEKGLPLLVKLLNASCAVFKREKPTFQRVFPTFELRINVP
jgi:hypothetical protein